MKEFSEMMPGMTPNQLAAAVVAVVPHVALLGMPHVRDVVPAAQIAAVHLPMSRRMLGTFVGGDGVKVVCVKGGQ